MSRRVGFRNSGISIGANGKFTVQVRGCNALEVPVSLGPKLLVDQSYLQFLIESANEKFKKNLSQIDKLFIEFEKELKTIEE